MIKNRKSIEALLAKFMDGRSSREEERVLAEYFCSADVPKEWRAYQEMFSYFDSGMPDVGVADNRIAHRKPLLRRVYWWIGGVAAVAMALLLLLPSINEVVPDKIASSEEMNVSRKQSDTIGRKAGQKPVRISTKPTKNIGRLMQERIVRRPPKRYFADAKTFGSKAATMSDSIVTDTLHTNVEGNWLAQAVESDTLRDTASPHQVADVEGSDINTELTKEDILAAIIQEQIKRAELLRTFVTLVVEEPCYDLDDKSEE